MNAIGMALARWSTVELHLCSLFQNIADMPSKDRAASMFDSIISLETRLAVVSNLMEGEDVDRVEAEMWRRMSAQLLTSYKKKRHPIAHFSIRSRGGVPHVAPFLTHTKLWVTGETLLSAEEIEERGEHFTLLARAITWFTIRAVHRRVRSETNQPTPPQEDQFVARLRELAIQNLAETKPRAQSSQV